MDLVLLGPPGAGKGTQASGLAREVASRHVSTGDILRDAVRTGSELGREVKTIMASGRLVPDGVVDRLVAEMLASPEGAKGVVLDGYPRTVTQAESLQQNLERIQRALRAVLLIDVKEDELVRRLGGRRSCPGCGALYHIEEQPPKSEGACDRCGGALQIREDDREEVVRERFKVYRTQTEPLVQWYSERGLLRSVDGSGAVSEVAKRLLQALGD